MIQVTLPLSRELEDTVEEWMWIMGASSVSLPPQHEENRTLKALFSELDEGAFGQALTEVRREWPEGLGEPAFETIREQAWMEQWREGFQPMNVGDFLIAGEWENMTVSPFLIRVYPGQAFGTGQHETTRLMILAAQRLNLTGKDVLDVGCGTGILAIVAERLGAASVFGFDLDPACEENMRHHLQINQCSQVTLAIGELADFSHEGGYDVILANITLNVLEMLWPKLKAMLRPEGTMVCSGILAEQREAAQTCLTQVGFTIDRIDEEGEWIAVEAHHS